MSLLKSCTFVHSKLFVTTTKCPIKSHLILAVNCQHIKTSSLFSGKNFKINSYIKSRVYRSATCGKGNSTSLSRLFKTKITKAKNNKI